MSSPVDTPGDDLLELQNTVNTLILDNSIGRAVVKSPQTSIRAVSLQRQHPERSIKIPPSQDGSRDGSIKRDGSMTRQQTSIVKPASVTPQIISQKLSQVGWLGDSQQTITKIGEDINQLTGRQTSRIVVMSLQRFDSLLKSRNSEVLKKQQQQNEMDLVSVTNTLRKQLELQASESSRRMSIFEKESTHRMYYFRKMKQFENRLSNQQAERKLRSAAIQLSELKNQLTSVVDVFRSVANSHPQTEAKPSHLEDALAASQQNEAALISVLQETLSHQLESLEGASLSKQPSRHLSDVSTPTDGLQLSFPSSQALSIGYSGSPSDSNLEPFSSPTLSLQAGGLCLNGFRSQTESRCFGVLSQEYQSG
eukprot:TRINITY_DN4839_c0_g4_i1.p1 TRINITY_DN4839_c0_g4~~TRINITY_DN4839_c0_g4_i1.p1  ORF type:complete len:366 (+),score=81.62 TRINITY_DN4839_c0_g4_i1:42-1139(+)